VVTTTWPVVATRGLSFEEASVTESTTAYPVRVDGSLDPTLSRGLWLLKWLLLLPHIVVLVFLWTAFVLLSVVAFLAILVTGRYPRSLFEFNVGVLRWTWRVHYYGYGALGTDWYPPFTLADVQDYPAHLDVDFPERLSRGLVLVKWWLLALPHYVVVALFVGGGIWWGIPSGNRSAEGPWDDAWGVGGLVALLVLVAGIVLLFTGRYPRPVFDFVMGMDRWALRVAAYAALMTDRYPPFRMDMGGADPSSTPARPISPPPLGTPAEGTSVGPDAGAYAVPSEPAASQHGRWTGGRIVVVVTGAVLLFISTGLLSGGGGLLWAHQTQRDGEYLWTARTQITTSQYALTSDTIRLDTEGAGWVVDDVLGTARLEVMPDSPRDQLFVGVADTAAVHDYLMGVGRHRMGDLGPRWARGGMRPGMTEVPGGAPEVPPTGTDIWAAESSGRGTQMLDWRPADGAWTVVVMRADGAAGIVAQARVGATVPGLPWLAGGLLMAGAALALIGALMVVIAVRRAQQGWPSSAVPSTDTGPAGPGPPRAGDPVLTSGHRP
jgi:hypothetical protein